MSEFLDFWTLYEKGRAYGFKDPVYAGGWHRGQDIPGVVPGMPWLGKNVPLLRPGTLYYRGYKSKIGYVQVYKVGDEFDTYCHTINTGSKTFRIATWGDKTGSSWGGPHIHLVRSKYWDAAWNTNRAVMDPRPVIKNRIAEMSRPASTKPPVVISPNEGDIVTEQVKVAGKHYFTVGSEFLTHHGNMPQANIVRSVMGGAVHHITSAQFLDLLDGLGIPRNVVNVKNGVVQGGALNPETGKISPNQVWSRTRQAVALLNTKK